MSMAELRAANVARDQEWNTGSERVSMTFRATELAGEVGEACNVIKKLERERIGLVGSRDTKEHLAEELADIVICTDLVAMDAGIDLDAAIAAKFNATSEKNGLCGFRHKFKQVFCGDRNKRARVESKLAQLLDTLDRKIIEDFFQPLALP
ncbi:MazG-like family protein [Brucella sp. 09RB8913]|uniref:MazG-like family protein n=1 Tax=Brucella sp. 09RB8913 TaxID=1844045 RepID=UPI001FFE4131|nr:MazG-like family protein [Brucella sp. 09RB8913]